MCTVENHGSGLHLSPAGLSSLVLEIFDTENRKERASELVPVGWASYA